MIVDESGTPDWTGVGRNDWLCHHSHHDRLNNGRSDAVACNILMNARRSAHHGTPERARVRA